MKKKLNRFIFILGKIFAFIFPFQKVGNNIFCQFKKKFFNSWISGSFASFGTNSEILSPLTLKGGQFIHIGNNSAIGKYAALTAYDKYQNIAYNPVIKIGDNVNIGDFCHITAINSIVIGNGVLSGKWLTVTDNTHGITDILMEQMPFNRPLQSSGSVVIEDNVWLGDKITILPNVRIGKNSIIGANSVVSHNIPANCVAGGIPARIIKMIECDTAEF